MTAAGLLALCKQKPAPAMPLFGVIQGGEYDGWRFRFMAFRVEPATDQGRVGIDLFASAPAWPFPRSIVIWMDGAEPVALNPVKGERTRRVLVKPLILACLGRADDLMEDC